MVEAPTPHQSSRRGETPQMVIIHGDAGTTDEGTVSWIQHPDSQVSYHFLVGRDGQVYHFVGEDRKAWHAGVSHWKGREDLNPVSIGVAFANDGSGDEMYTDAQYDVGAELVADIINRHGIRLDMIRGHFEVSPGRKTDPWEWFHWERFYGRLGMYAAGRVS